MISTSTDADDLFNVREFMRRVNPTTNLFGRLIVHLNRNALSALVRRIHTRYPYTEHMENFANIVSALFENDSNMLSQQLRKEIIPAACRELGITDADAFIARFLNNSRFSRMPTNVRSFLYQCVLHTLGNDLSPLEAIRKHQNYRRFVEGLRSD